VAPEVEAKPSPVLPLLQLPSVAVLFLWMIVPLAMTIYFSFVRKNLLNPELTGFAGLG
jgi:polyol transport system permease protein